MSEVPSAICLVIDRLSAAYLGALGNTWIRTPEFDRLAARSLVFDRALIDSPELDRLYGSYWTGTPASYADTALDGASERSLPGWCRTQGIPTILVTDDGDIAAHRLAEAFDEIVHVAQPAPRGQAGDWQETQLAAYFAAAVELLETRRPPALVWLHSGALGHLWDSPQSLRDQYAAEDDPPAPSLVEPPSLVLSGATDPDVLLGLRHAYAGEVSVLDHCLGMLQHTIDGGAWQNSLFWVTSCRGYPLGEHGIVGGMPEALYGELVRAVSCIRLPGGPKYGAHSHALAQSQDHCATLREWFSSAPATAVEEARPWSTGRSLLHLADESSSPRKLAIVRSGAGEMALATPAWFVRASARGAANEQAAVAQDLGKYRIELFVEPDDYFQVNEVADRCRDIAEEFQHVAAQVENASMRGSPPDIELSDALLHGIEGMSLR